MFAKVWTTTSLVLALSLRVNAHAAVAPVLGLSVNPQRSDVQRPNGINPCGRGVDAASLIDTSTAVPVDDTGSFKATVFNFNKGLDGSRQMKAAVDPTGTGQSFTAMTVTTNGDLISKDLGSQPIVAALPAGTTCTGGASGNLCLVQFKNPIGFGNCMVVSQGDAAANTASASGNSTSTDSSSASAGTSDSADSSSSTGTTDSADTGSGSTGSSDSTASSDSTNTSGASATSTTGAEAATATDAADSSSGAGEAAGAGAAAAAGAAGATAAKGGVAGKLAGIKAAIGKAKGAAAGKGGVAGKLAGLKAKLQGRAPQPGTRAARSLLAELRVAV